MFSGCFCNQMWASFSLPCPLEVRIKVGDVLTVCLLIPSFHAASLFTCQSRHENQLLHQFWRKNHQKYYLKAKIHGDGCTTNHVLFSRVCWVTLWSGPLSWPPSTRHHILPASLSLRSSILSLPLALFLSEQWEIPSPVSVRPVNSYSLKFGGPVAIQPLEYHCTSKLLLRVFP